MENKNVAFKIVSMMCGVLFVILGAVNFSSPNDTTELILGFIYLLSGLTMVGLSIYGLIVKK